MPAILGLTHCPKPFAAMGRSHGKHHKSIKSTAVISVS